MLTKKQILEYLERENVDLGSNPGRTFVYYQEMGLLPKSESFLPNNKTIALFPNWTPKLIKNIKAYQREGKKLSEVKKVLDENRQKGKEIKKDLGLEDEEEWKALEKKIGEQKVEEIRDTHKKIADLFGSYWIKWKNLERIAPEAVYIEWWKKNHDKPIAEALNRLELKVKGRKCKAKDCNNIFVPKRSDQVYCSVNCRTRAFHQRKRANSTDKS